MKNFIVWLLIAFIFIGSVVYFVFTSDKSFTVTYIKFNNNPEFIIGVNSQDEVKIFNPLNDGAKILNINMFNGLNFEESIEKILNKLDSSNYLNLNEFDITIITKSDKKIAYYYNKINNVITKKNLNLNLINNNASHDELLAYSNEVSYDIKPSYDNLVLKEIASNLQLEISDYINSLINGLSIEELDMVSKQDIINQKSLEGYFNNYNLLDYKISNYNLTINEGSKYAVNFLYNDEGITFNIELNLVLEHKRSHIVENQNYNIIEEYHFNFNNEVYGLKNNFYKFN